MNWSDSELMRNMCIYLNQLFSRLEPRMASWDENTIIGDIFEEMVLWHTTHNTLRVITRAYSHMHINFLQAPFLKIYKDYENNYGKALDVYSQLLNDPTFNAAIEVCFPRFILSLRKLSFYSLRLHIKVIHL